ncbi:hypothetical protein ACU4GD_12960 [Cupriavidus basilensis]
MLLGAVLACGGCAELPRDINGSPPTARLVPNGVPPAPITPEERQKLDALNQQVLRERKPPSHTSNRPRPWRRLLPMPIQAGACITEGGAGGHWGGGVGFSGPGYWGRGGYPYWW